MTYKHAATHCNTLQHAAKRCNTLQHSATHCNTLQHTATHCSALQHTAAHCNTLQHTARHNISKTKRAPTIFKKRIFGVGVADTCVARIIQHCNSLQHTATCYRTLHFEVEKGAHHLQEANPLILVLQESFSTATRCNTLQHTTFWKKTDAHHLRGANPRRQSCWHLCCTNQIDRAPLWISGFYLRYQEPVHISNI